ncbi:MAG TPA: flagellar motor switch protein FliN [Candidatus Dormibacteraeota bacterium]|nr:flagellar motor switch protein FliN [Candidatus Dormibacteraeota bacterium]
MQGEERTELDALRAVPLDLVAVLGGRRMKLAELLELGEGAVVELDRAADAPVDVLVGGAVIARGEIVAVDGRFGVRITEVVCA